ncbi:MAG: DUF4194 domain-containing protein [Acidipropionibacterium sp.]|nr:DUF4194 domain-containing protein [Acidipropionibacterium sp.]
MLLQLLRGPYIHRERHPKLWPVVIRDEEILRSRLADLFLSLVVDTERGVAFIRNAVPAEADDIPKVTRSTPLSLIDTGLVLLLRDALLRAETQDTRAFIDRAEIDDALSVYRPATSTDEAMFERRVSSAVERFKANSGAAVDRRARAVRDLPGAGAHLRRRPGRDRARSHRPAPRRATGGQPMTASSLRIPSISDGSGEPGIELPGQFRLSRIQLVNWGTFNGYCDIAVPRKGVLITGASGSGKSSLLDAIAAVMVQPRWLAFNAAAQQSGQGDRSRNVLSYVRGAHRRDVDDATGQVTTAYLRSGATWSGIALTFDDAAGRTVSLIRLMHASQQASGPRDVNSLYLDADEAVDLQSLEPLAANGIDSRGIKAAHPGWTSTKHYSAFANRIQRKLGLASDQAQRLLHKTQSAKNLGNLNALLRDFMLDEPDTFALADQAVDQFEELSGAHRAVVEARDQVAALEPLEAIAAAHRRAVERLALLKAEQHHAETFFTARRIEVADSLIEGHRTTLEGLRTEIAAAAQREQDAVTATQRCRARIAGLGGDRIPDLERLRGEHEATLARRRSDLFEAREKAERCDVTLPSSTQEWGDWEALLDAALAEIESQEKAQGPADYEAQRGYVQAREEAQRLTESLAILQAQRSNMEPSLLAARSELAERLGVETSELPFAGELIDVDPGQSEWQGAIERVLRPLARTLLVPERLYAETASQVDRRSWHTRLVWERVHPGIDSPAEDFDANTLPGKVAVLASSPFAGWLTRTIGRRYDYRCLDDTAEFRGYDRALTRAGQVKHSRTRHEKDDRWPVGDRTRWLLGSSTEAKQEALREAIDAAEVRRDEARDTADKLASAAQDRRDRRRELNDLRRIGPEDVDVAAAQAKIDAVNAELERTEGREPGSGPGRERAPGSGRGRERGQGGGAASRDLRRSPGEQDLLPHHSARRLADRAQAGRGDPRSGPRGSGGQGPGPGPAPRQSRRGARSWRHRDPPPLDYVRHQRGPAGHPVLPGPADQERRESDAEVQGALAGTGRGSVDRRRLSARVSAAARTVARGPAARVRGPVLRAAAESVPQQHHRPVQPDQDLAARGAQSDRPDQRLADAHRVLTRLPPPGAGQRPRPAGGPGIPPRTPGDHRRLGLRCDGGRRRPRGAPRGRGAVPADTAADGPAALPGAGRPQVARSVPRHPAACRVPRRGDRRRCPRGRFLRGRRRPLRRRAAEVRHLLPGGGPALSAGPRRQRSAPVRTGRPRRGLRQDRPGVHPRRARGVPQLRFPAAAGHSDEDAPDPGGLCRRGRPVPERAGPAEPDPRAPVRGGRRR